jgi:ubiquinone/menaquinone biosynthesis C-methylase UbiE
MPVAQGTAFDKLAAEYEAVWSESVIGKAQRVAVWNRINPLFNAGDVVLDVGCGTGTDALHLQSRGLSVYGIDSSPQMIAIAKRRGVHAQVCPIEQLEHLDLAVDGILSNFGALNCLESLASFAFTAARLIRAGGHMALCLFNRVCLWEIAFYLLRGRPSKAFRRLKTKATSSIGVTVFYPSCAAITSAFKKNFRLINSYGIGLLIPPSYVGCRSAWLIEQLSAIDTHLINRPVFRSVADHRLYIFQRL